MSGPAWIWKGIQKKALWIEILAVLLFLATGSGWCSSHTEVPDHSEVISAVPHNTPDQGETHQHSASIPLIYELYWIGLIAMVVLMVLYFFFLHQREKYRFIKPLTLLFIFMALSLYLMEQGRVFSGYFDSVGKIFVPGYHEANEIGFLRFFYKLTLGIALWAYGFITYLDRLKNKKISTFMGGAKVTQGEGE